ncbi:MAG: histidine kinase dimerization/phosphoacceptor domain -containing protein [Spirochaetota bacterium]|nr:histidine kinase dimerization/phosphoacceptor domain -containing protein [Spirochaetota bacterium]
MKRYIISFLIATILINSLGLTAFFLIHTHINFIHTRDGEIAEIEQEMLDKLNNLTILIKPFEEQAREFNEAILIELADTIFAGSDPDPVSLNNDDLQELVKRYELIDVYLIDRSGTIVRSSFTDDVGLNLLALEPNFADFIRSVYGAEKVMTQRLSLSNMSGSKMIYSYYSPGGSDWIIETSVNFEEFLRSRHSDELYDFLFHAYFEQVPCSHSQLKSFDIIYLTTASARSFLTGLEAPIEPHIIDVINRGETYAVREGNLQTIFMKRKMEKKEFDFVQYPILRMEYDLSAYYRFLLMFYVISAFGIILFIGLLSGLTFRLVEKKLVVRIEELADVLQRSTEQDYSRRVDYSSRIPEMMKLANSTNRLIERVADSEQRLKRALNERETLLDEINHRVKNNLNVVVSLLNLQSDRIGSVEEAQEALLKTKNRIFSMALTHEKLYQSEDFSDVKMRPYIETLASNIHTLFGDHQEVLIETDVQEVCLPIGYAIPCGIIINELLMNAYTHAFPAVDGGGAGSSSGSGPEGRIRIRLYESDNSRYILTVEDNGTGLPDDFAIETLDSLGLNLVQILAEQLGGSMSIRSEGGTRFEVNFFTEKN